MRRTARWGFSLWGVVRRVGGMALAVMLAAAVTFAAAEGVLRTLGGTPRTVSVFSVFFEHHRVGWRGRPNVSMNFVTDDFESEISHGPDGFRVGPTFVPTSTDVVWVFGGSHTWGWGVSDGATLIDVMNAKARPDVVFRNFGVPGFGSLQEYLLLQELLGRPDQVHPSMVLIMFDESDLRENLSGDAGGRTPYYALESGQFVIGGLPVARRIRSDLYRWIRANSRAYNELHFIVRRTKHRVVSWFPRSEAPRANSRGNELEWRALGESYQAIADLSLRHGATPAVAFVPFGLVGGGRAPSDESIVRDREVRERLRGVARAAGLEFIDVSFAFERQLRAADVDLEPLVFPGDGHLTPRAHAVVAEGILEILKRPTVPE